MPSRKVSISLPEDLLRRVDEVCRRLGLSRSEFVAMALREKLGYTGEEPQEYPTVLWKLRASGLLRARSPRYPGRRVRCRWVVEEVSER